MCSFLFANDSREYTCTFFRTERERKIEKERHEVEAVKAKREKVALFALVTKTCRDRRRENACDSFSRIDRLSGFSFESEKR